MERGRTHSRLRELAVVRQVTSGARPPVRVCCQHGLAAGEANLDRCINDVSTAGWLHASLNAVSPAEVDATHADGRNRP